MLVGCHVLNKRLGSLGQLESEDKNRVKGKNLDLRKREAHRQRSPSGSGVSKHFIKLLLPASCVSGSPTTGP